MSSLTNNHEVAVGCDVAPEDVTPEIEARWIRDMQCDFPWMAAGLAETLIGQWKIDPGYFTSDEFKAKVQEFTGRAQELRGEASNGSYEHLTSGESYWYWQEREHKNIAELEVKQ